LGKREEGGGVYQQKNNQTLTFSTNYLIINEFLASSVEAFFFSSNLCNRLVDDKAHTYEHII